MNKDSTFEERKEGGTKTEDIFEEYCLSKNILFYKSGIDEHPFGVKLYKVNRMIRNIPDYIVINGSAFFIEVKGGGSTIGIKRKDFKSYGEWNKIMKVYYYLYFHSYEEAIKISHDKLKNIVPNCEIKQHNEASKYDDKKYYEIPYEVVK